MIEILPLLKNLSFSPKLTNKNNITNIFLGLKIFYLKKIVYKFKMEKFPYLTLIEVN